MPGKWISIVAAMVVLIGACTSGGEANPTSLPPSAETTAAASSTSARDGTPTTSVDDSSDSAFGPLPVVAALPGQLWEFIGGTPGALQWSPDGQTLAFASTVAIYLYRFDDFAAEPTLLRTGQAVFAPHEVAFTPDGSRVAVTVGDGIRVWDTASGVEVASVAVPGSTNVAFVDDATVVALGANHAVAVDIASSAVLWTDEFDGSLPVLSGRLAVDPDTSQVLYGAGPTTVLRSGAGEILVESVGSDPVVAVAFSDLGIITTDGSRINLLDRANGVETDESLMPFGASRVKLVSDGASVFIDNGGAIGRWIPSIDGDSRLSDVVFEDVFVGLHPIGDGTALSSFGAFDGLSVIRTDDLAGVGGAFDESVGIVEGLAVSSTGRVAVATPSQVVAFDLADPATTVVNRGGPLRAIQVDDVALAAGAEAVGWTSLGGNRAILWDPHTNELIDSTELEPANRTFGIVLDDSAGRVFIDDGVSFSTLPYERGGSAAGVARSTLSGGSNDGFLVTKDGPCLIVRDVTTYGEIGVIASGYTVRELAAAGELVVTEGFGDFDGIRAFDLTGDLATRETCRRGETPPTWQLASDGTLVGVWSGEVVVLDGGTVQRIDVASGNIISESAINLGDDRVFGAAYDPDSGRIAVSSRDQLSLYSTETGDLIVTYARSGTPMFDPTGRYLLITADASIWVVDVGPN